MKRLALVIAIAGIMLTLDGCAVYAPPYSYPGSYGYAPYGGYGYGYGYGYPFYGYYGFGPRFYGGGWRGGYYGGGWRGGYGGRR